MTPKNIVMLIFAVVGVMSLVSFISMGVDKSRAVRHKRRTPEKTLFTLAILMGATGGTLGMYAFRHKTQHWYFALFFPLLSIIQIAVCVYASIRILHG